MQYQLETPDYKHYGKNVELLIKRAVELDNEQERDNAIISIGKLMKTLYKSYNKENITDDVILGDIRQMSKGKLNMDLAYIESNNLFESNGKSQSQDNNSRSQQNRGGDRNRKNNSRSSHTRNK